MTWFVGPPGVNEEDYDLPVWAGVIPVKYQILPPVPDPRSLDGLVPPDHVTEFKMGSDLC
ncbi:MAG: hypothetical protein AAF530_05570 [Pseudomonadota bacterium]